MRSVTQEKQWKLFKEIEKLPADSPKRYKLLREFNRILPEARSNKMYNETKFDCKTCEDTGVVESIDTAEPDNPIEAICPDCQLEV